MSVNFYQYGSFEGRSNEDLRVVIKGPGQKNALAILASYHPSDLAKFADQLFYGRLLAVEGELPEPVGPVPVGEIEVLSDIKLKKIFDITLHSSGPHSFLFPLAELEGNIKTSLSGSLTVVLSRGYTVADLPTYPAVSTFVPRLTISGQTLFSGKGRI